MGPALLLDVVGLDTANHVQHVMAEGYPGRMVVEEHNVISPVCRTETAGAKAASGFTAILMTAKATCRNSPMNSSKKCLVHWDARPVTLLQTGLSTA